MTAEQMIRLAENQAARADFAWWLFGEFTMRGPMLDWCFAAMSSTINDEDALKARIARTK